MKNMTVHCMGHFHQLVSWDGKSFFQTGTLQSSESYWPIALEHGTPWNCNTGTRDEGLDKAFLLGLQPLNSKRGVFDIGENDVCCFRFSVGGWKD